MNTLRTFDGLVALVTGGASGIGAATVQRLFDEGAHAIFVADRDEAAARSVAESVGGVALTVDVADSASVDAAFAAVLAIHNRIDVVVHSAGVDDPEAKEQMYRATHDGTPVRVTESLSDERWGMMISINLTGAFNVLRASVQAMAPRGAGAIVLVGSLAGFDTMAGYPHYSAAKAGLHALSQSVAKEMAPLGVRVNVVAPGPVDTAMARHATESLRESVIGDTRGGYASAEQIADNIIYLASPGAANIVGAVLLSNGGRSTF